MLLASLCRRWAVAGAFVVALGASGRAHAQSAWVNDPGSLTASLGYQYVPSDAIITGGTGPTGAPVPNINNRPTTNHVVTLSAEYVPIENLGIDVTIPWLAASYDGDLVNAPHFPKNGPWDDNKTHTSFTDFRAGVHYQLLDEPYVALTPYVAVTLPMQNYATQGFATGGRNLRQLHFGVGIGRSLSPYVRNLFITGYYEYTASEGYDVNALTAKINQNRSDAAVTLGYMFLHGKLVVDLAGNWRQQHGGIAFADFGMYTGQRITLTVYHDPLLKESYMFYGGDVSYAISDKLSIDASVRQFLSGENTREQALYGIDLSWRVL